jgi:CPA2 family monovalent cation:H+ antiporter-2
VSLQIAILLVAGLPLLAVAQPFLPEFPWELLLGVGLLALAVPLWRGAANLDGHVRAGAEVILEALGNQSRAGDAAADAPAATGGGDLTRLVPGLGQAGSLRLAPEHFAVGRTLKQTNLRGKTGASVIAIRRDAGTVFPSAEEMLGIGDTLVLTGTEDAVAAARDLLTGGPERQSV